MGDLYSKIEVNVPKADACADHVRTPALKPVARAFARNSLDILGVVSLPHAFLSRGISLGYVVGVQSKKFPNSTTLTVTQAEGHVDEILQNWDRHTEDSQMRDAIFAAADTEISNLLTQSSNLNYYFNALLRAATAAAWTMFECLAKDMWTVAQPILKLGIPERSFRRVEKIVAAYQALFGTDPTLDGFLVNLDLRILEESRHLIVHRGGIVDEVYLNATRQQFPLGGILPLDGEEVSRLTNVSISCGCDLLTFVDNVLTAP